MIQGVNCTELVDVLGGVLGDNNFRVALGALECLKLICDKFGELIKQSISRTMEPLSKRLGDGKVGVIL